MIQVENLARRYQDRDKPVHALRGVSFSIGAGEMVGVTGPSGSGKSTLLRILGALDTHFDGRVRVDGVEIETMSEAEAVEFRARKVGFVFQDFSLLTHLTVLENLLLTTMFRRGASADRRDAELRAHHLLSEVGLEQRAHALPSTLSGGQQQRVAIARALMGRPTLLLCDEPTGNLDLATGGRILDLIAETREKTGVTVLVVTHEPHVVARMDRQISLRDGRLAGDGADDGEGADGGASPSAGSPGRQR